MSKLNDMLKKQNKCEHKNVVKRDSKIIGCYYECVDCEKMSAVSYYFKHYKEERTQEEIYCFCGYERDDKSKEGMDDWDKHIKECPNYHYKMKEEEKLSPSFDKNIDW